MFRDKPARTKAWQYLNVYFDRGFWKTAGGPLTYSGSNTPISNLNAMLNQIGVDGWEAVHFSEDNGVIKEVIFKREMRKTLNDLQIQFGSGDSNLSFPRE